ncbi:MAG: metallophosphoesterase [Sandaracinaceae bacterium]|nr:metallophosphoesterase [Sandaracinaceae bacterium]
MSRRSSLTCIVSDIHFPHTMEAEWASFREFHREVRPETTIIGGDFLDLNQMSSFTQDANASIYIIPEIQQFVAEANALAKECGTLYIVEGNHEARWNRFLEPVAAKLRGAIGLTLKAQCIAQGLTPRAIWRKESAADRGIKIQQFVFRHGDKDFGRYGGGKHAASALIDKGYGGESAIVGHLHQCQMIARRRTDQEVLIALCNGTFEKPADYAPANSWIYGFTLVEKCSDKWGTPHPIVIEKGCFAYGGRVYDGNEALRKVPPTPAPKPVASDVMLPSRAPVPYYMPHGDPPPVPPNAMDDRVGHLVQQLDVLRKDTRDYVERLSGITPIEDDRLLSPVAALPPPAPPPANEHPTLDEHPKGELITHPVTGEMGNASAWARKLGLSRTTLRDRIERTKRDPEYTLEMALRPGSKAA